MTRYKLIEAFVKIFLWIAVIIIYVMYFSEVMRPLPDGLETAIITVALSLTLILIWFMPSSIADRKVNKGLKYLDRDNDKAVRYFEDYLDSKMLSESERKNTLRIMGVTHHKRGDDEEAIRCLNQALEGHDGDNDLKVEILGAMGMIYSESGEYQKAVEHFDRTFDIIFAMSKAHIDKAALVLAVNTYIKAGKKEKAVMIYDRLLMIQGFRRDRRVEELLDI